MNNISPIFRFLKAKTVAGQQTVLVTLVAVTGASTRNPGAHMAVAEDGSFAGSFSGGCVETAVVSEALEVIESGRPREIRFGSGSRYLDIRLPCGGSIDLLFTPIRDPAVVAAIHDRIEERAPFTIALDSEDGGIGCEALGLHSNAVEREGSRISVDHIPAARVVILGHGPSVESLTKLSLSYEIECAVLSPDPVVVEQAQALGCSAALLKTPDATALLNPDPWTACIFYFHDHDWEAQLMKQALASPAFYVGAMGSRTTHAARQDRLGEIGVPAEQIARMVAPIGLIASTRDPATLALSTLAQIVEHYHRQYGYKT